MTSVRSLVPKQRWEAWKALVLAGVLGLGGIALCCHSARAQNVSSHPVSSSTEALDRAVRNSDAGSDERDAGLVVQPLLLDASVPVAIGRGVVVTAGELYQRVMDAPEPTRQRWASDPRLLEELLDRLVADRLLANEARRLGLENDPAVRAAVERALVARLRATVINPSVGDGSTVTMDEIRAFYLSNPQRFHIPERRRALVVFVTDRRQAERILQQVHPSRRARRRRPVDFRELARRYNTDPELLRTDGEIQEVTATQEDLDPALRNAIFAIDRAGEVYRQVVPGRWNGSEGYFVVRLLSRRPPIDRTLEESVDWIRQRIVLERRVRAERALVERLAREAGVVRMPTERVVRIVAVDAGETNR